MERRKWETHPIRGCAAPHWSGPILLTNISSVSCHVFLPSWDSTARQRNDRGMISEKIHRPGYPSLFVPSSTISLPTFRASNVRVIPRKGLIQTHCHTSLSGVVKPNRGSRSDAILRLTPVADPDVLYPPAIQDPSKVSLALLSDRRTVRPKVLVIYLPVTDKLAEEH